MVELNPFPGLTGRAVEGVGMTLAHWRFDPGTVLPTHQHESAQLTWVIAGSLTMTIDGSETTLGKGDRVAIPAWVPHSGVAGPNGAEVIDGFTPERVW